MLARRLGVDAEAVKSEALRRLKREQEGEGAPIKKKTVVRPLSRSNNSKNFLCILKYESGTLIRKLHRSHVPWI